MLQRMVVLPQIFVPIFLIVFIMTSAATSSSSSSSSSPPRTSTNRNDQTIVSSSLLKDFAFAVPKVELHAHLNGCVRESTLLELAQQRGIALSDHYFSIKRQAAASPSSSSLPENDIGATQAHLYNSNARSLMECFEVFEQISRVVRDLETLRRVTREALEDFAAHHVAYLELRTTPKRLYVRAMMNDNAGSRETAAMATKQDYLHVIQQVFSEFEQEEQERYRRERQQGKTSTPRLPLIPRLLVSIDRSKSVQEADENVDLAIAAFTSPHNKYVVGVDLGGNPAKNDFQDFVAPLARARDVGLQLTLHCGEIPHTEDNDEHSDHRQKQQQQQQQQTTNQNGEMSENSEKQRQKLKATKDAKAIIAFRPDRLGHALLLPKSLQRMLTEYQIPIESCPTSNVMTLELAQDFHGHLVEGLRKHPQLEHWLQSDYPISVSTDDPGVFHTNPSQELFLLGVAWNVPPDKLQHIIIQSMNHAFCSPQLKAQIQENLLYYFEKARQDYEEASKNMLTQRLVR